MSENTKSKMTEKKEQRKRLEQQIRFIIEADKVKSVFRQTYLADGSRKEKAIPMALIITGISYNGYIRMHTFTLSGEVVKNELIQPINNKIKVSGNADTDVIFTDIESRKQYTIGYITHGMSETIQLEKGKWYSVEGAGELTIRPVNVRIE